MSDNPRPQWKITDVNVPVFGLLNWMLKWLFCCLIIALLTAGVFYLAFRIIEPDLKRPGLFKGFDPKSSTEIVPPSLPGTQKIDAQGVYPVDISRASTTPTTTPHFYTVPRNYTLNRSISSFNGQLSEYLEFRVGPNSASMRRATEAEMRELPASNPPVSVPQPQIRR